MTESRTTTPPFTWIPELIGVDCLAQPPIFIRSRRIRGRLRHERLESLPKGSSVHTVGCVANSESVVRRLEAPYSAAVKARRVFPALLDLRLPFPETECERVFLDIQPVSGGGMQTLAVAARRSAIRSRLAAYKTLGSDPLALDQEGLALWTQSMLEDPPPDNNQAEAVQVVVALRPKQSTLCIGRNGRLLSTGNLSGDIVTDIDRRLKALEMATDQPLDLRWTGPEAVDPETVDALKQAFQRLRPAASQITHKTPETMLARALTTRALTNGPYRCNLRTGELIHPAILHRRQRHTQYNNAIMAITGLGLLAVGLFWHASSRQHVNRMRHEVSRRAETIIGHPTALRGGDAVAEARRHVDDIRRQTQPFVELMAAGTSAGLDAVVKLAQQHHITIHALEIEHGALIRLDGSAQTWEAVTALEDNMTSRFGPLAAQRQWDAETEDETISFQIKPVP